MSIRPLLALILIANSAIAAEFRAGVHVTDITPPSFPVRVNGGFSERTAKSAADPLYARAFALDDGDTQLVFCIVDTCMMPRDLIDEAKAIVAKEAKIDSSQMMVSATHTHSAPSAMGCLGTRMDADYAAWLPVKLAEAMLGALANRQPARVGWAHIDAPAYTHNRRWINRLDQVGTDPFGARNVYANMHPGHLSQKVIGPSGPVDSGLSILALTKPDGRPIGLLANYSQHYYGAPLLSADYFGAFARIMADKLDSNLVAAMSQGTSGDLMWADYSAPRHRLPMEQYAGKIAELAHRAFQDIDWQDHAPLAIAERKLDLAFRVPDADRLAWAQQRAKALGDKLPRGKPDIYALEALYLDARPRAELKLQAIRIGDLGIATLPNEVYALTGLQLKAQSPFTSHFNISLANGAEGYIPPPAQFALGGYTTWPARTAGLEETAEPQIVDSLLSALEEVADKPRRPLVDPPHSYAGAVLASKPVSYWRLNDMHGNPRNAVSAESATVSGRVAHFLPGVADQALHLVDGAIELPLPQGEFSIATWFWLGVRSGASTRSGSLIRMQGLDIVAEQDDGHQARILDLELPADAWHMAVLTSDGRLSIDGAVQSTEAKPSGSTVTLGVGLEGKLDEIATWNRVLSDAEIAALHKAAGLRPMRVSGRQQFEQPGLGQHYSVSMSFRNDLPNNRRPVTAYLFSRGPSGHSQAPGEHVGIGGTYRADLTGKLIVFNGNQANDILVGKTTIEPGTDYQLRFEREGLRVRTWLNDTLEIDAELPITSNASSVFLGARCDNFAPLVGETAEFAFTAKTMRSSQLQVPDGFVIELAASEPQIADPVAIDWGPDGKLWVAEMADYPYGCEGGGRVRFLEDKDGDGRYETSSLFLEGLTFPTGVMAWRDGVLVTAAPDIFFAADRDGDGKAEYRENLYSGFIQGNQQLRVNGLRWGLDNWVHVASGAHHAGFGKDSKIHSSRADSTLHLGSRDLRIRPASGAIEALSGPSQFGRNRDDWGNWFGVQNSHPIWHYLLPDRYLRRNPKLPPRDPRRQLMSKNPPVFPLSAEQKRYHSVKHHRRYTSACSATIYRDKLLFPADGTRHAFTCEPYHNLVQHNLLSREGLSFRAERAPGITDFFVSSDRFCRPVMARTGPDGALWIVDMHRYMIEHPDWLPAAGKAELKPNYRQGEEKGRIYRVYRKEAPPRKTPQLQDLAAADLVTTLAHPNGILRDQAQRLLLAHPAARPLLETMAQNHANPLARLHALCTLDGLGVLTPAVLAPALAADNPELRRQALRLAESHPDLSADVANAGRDADPMVRLQAAFSLGQFADSAPSLAALARETEDETILFALRSSGKLADSASTKPVSSSAPAATARDLALIATHRAALSMTGDGQRGKVVFAKLCIACHPLADSAISIGPDLRALTERTPEGLFAAILNPNEVVDPGYVATTVTFKDGRSAFGRITAQTDTGIVLRSLDGKESGILKTDIATITRSTRSLMPEGLEQAMSTQELADLLAYLLAL